MNKPANLPNTSTINANTQNQSGQKTGQKGLTDQNGNNATKSDKGDTNTESASQTLISSSGFAGSNWGDAFVEVKKGALGKVKAIQEGEFILTSYKEFHIRYGFYREELKVSAKPANNGNSNPQQNANTQPTNMSDSDRQKELMSDRERREKAQNDSARLFYVTLELPYIASEKIEKKLEAKLGQSKGRQVSQKRGLVWWETDKTLVILWLDAVNGNSYTRKIDFIGKEIRDEINRKQQSRDRKRENNVVKGLNF